MAVFVLTDQIREPKPRWKWEVTKQQQWGAWPHATSDPSLPPITAAVPAKHALIINQALGEWQGQSTHKGRAEGKGLMLHSAWRQSGYAVIPAHDRKKKEEGKLCQTFITDKGKAGSSTRFERTLINRVDRWSPVVPHPHENLFPFLVCQFLPIPCLLQSWQVTALFTEFSLVLLFTEKVVFGRQYHSRELSEARASSHQLCLSTPFISYLSSIHIQRTNTLARPFACLVIGVDGTNVRKCMLAIIYVTHYLPPGYLPCIM